MRALAPTVCDSVLFVIVSVNVFYVLYVRACFYICMLILSREKGTHAADFVHLDGTKSCCSYFWIFHYVESFAFLLLCLHMDEPGF
jgi:hypothetical protein